VRRFVFARARQAAIVVAVVVTLAFALAHLAPGNPFWALDNPRISQVERERLSAVWGYDQPVWRQYVRWLSNFATGEFGWSHSRSQPVSTVLRETVPNTLLLMAPALVLGLLAGIALGTWQAAARSRVLARLSDLATLVLVSMPDFVVALAVLTLFAAHWHLAPASGMTDPVFHDTMSLGHRIADIAAHMVLPCATLALLVAASVSRYHRAAVLGVMQEEFVRAARAKGVPERRVLLQHVLRNALGPVIAIGGLLLPAMFAGAVFVEKVFAWPGMGRTLVEAVAGRDYHLMQAMVVVGTVLVTCAGAAADVLAVIVNPRTRLDA
jgi:peptide/nickel transport system permease protein